MTAEGRVRFGPAGQSDAFNASGRRGAHEAVQWAAETGLDAWEMAFGHGVYLKKEACGTVRSAAEEKGVTLSAHAPYYVNLANPDPEKRLRSFRYLEETAETLLACGGREIVVHTGSGMKQDRGDAIELIREGLREILLRLEDSGLSDARLCPETMGRPGQIGDLDEILDLCLTDGRLIPCVDFAHLHALTRGAMDAPEAFERTLDRAEEILGAERARGMHMHFSTIEYALGGEKRHRTFAETEYGPDYRHLTPLLAERKYRGIMICECKGTQDADAALMKRAYMEALGDTPGKEEPNG